MINLQALRAALAATVTQAVAPLPFSVAVYEYPPGGVTEYPAVIVGQPGWAPGQNFCLQKITVAVSVVVARPGIDDQATIAELEQVWPAVLVSLQNQLVADQTLGGLCAAAEVTRAWPGEIGLGSQRLPAQSIEIELHG